MNRFSSLNLSMESFMACLRPVLVEVQNGRYGAGAGLLVGDGQVLTSYHVVARSRSIRVKLDDGNLFNADILYRESGTDLALLEIPATNLPSATFSEREPRPGELVFAFGHPWGQRAVLTAGVISAVTSIHTKDGEFPILRTDARLAPGNSGGPLLNSAGEVIGINAMILGGDQSIAVPTSVIRQFLRRAKVNNPVRNVREEVI